MVFASKPFARYPDTIDDLFEKGIPLKQVTEAIKAHHKPVSHLFYSGLGMNGMFRESEILMEVLLRLKDSGIVALPIHDAVMVREDMEDEARSVMLEVFKVRTGIDGTVKAEGCP